MMPLLQDYLAMSTQLLTGNPRTRTLPVRSYNISAKRKYASPIGWTESTQNYTKAVIEIFIH